MTKRFYNTSSAVRHPGLLHILPEAIVQAEHYLETHPELEEVYVVEVVRIVRRTPRPIEVVEVRK